MSALEQTVSDIRPRIQQLEELTGESLEHEMKELKAALMANPDAVALMLPEDIGALVAALRRVTGQTMVSAQSKSKTKAKPKTMTKEEIAAAMDEL